MVYPRLLEFENFSLGLNTVKDENSILKSMMSEYLGLVMSMCLIRIKSLQFMNILILVFDQL